MTAKEYCIAFCEGYFYAQLGEKYIYSNATVPKTFGLLILSKV